MDRDSGCCGESAPVRVTRRSLLRGASALAGGLALSAALPRSASLAGVTPVAAAQEQAAGGVVVRWLGGGVVEVATADDKQIAYVDAWIWSNAGWDRMGVQRPPEYSSPDAFAEYVQGRNPEAVFVLLTHDHPDHMGNFFETLGALSGAGVNVKAVAQGDMVRSPTGLLPRFQQAGLDPAQLVLGPNFGGRATHGAMKAIMVPAVHSTNTGYPPAGYILEIGGVRFYASGDTDLYGDLRLVGERYQPDVALVSAGNGGATMGPFDAALACQFLGVSQAFPIHYGHSAAVLGPQAGDEFRQAMAELAPGTSVHTPLPGQTVTV